ncbi:MAG: M20/M25/M40 family metallo-hydrolase, partial [Solobacterium sp.]|nr:M20/M25/M40 family metallo-hydrolase [Solobacterium sp.]
MENYINNNIDNMLNELGELVSYNSVYSEDVAPFGLKNREVLDKALEIFESKGLKTKNLDYYCGYGEVGEGDEVIGILAHLDVVPCGEGWNSDPFKMTEKDGYVYGRGVTDDKGAVIASLYAIKYLLDTGYKFNKRVRLIVGCNEESGSRCIKHYVEKEGHIDYG